MQGRGLTPFLEPGGSFLYGQLEPACFPAVVKGPGTQKTSFGFYDRWSETYNLETEFVALHTARGLAAAGYLAKLASPSLTTDPWQRAAGSISLTPDPPAINALNTAIMNCSLPDFSQARVTWDMAGHEPAIAPVFAFVPTTVGENRTLQGEAVLPDGRRVFASTTFAVYDPIRGGTPFPDPAPGNHTVVGLYHFDSTVNSGTQFQDTSGNGYNLTIHGNVALSDNTTWMNNYPDPASGKVCRFHDAGDYVETTTIADFLSSGSSLTIEFRIYPRAYKGSSALHLFWLSEDSDTEWSIWGQAPVFQIYGCQGNASVLLNQNDYDSLITLNTWHAIKITLDPSGTTRLYVDGAPQGTSTVAPNYSRTSLWTLRFGDFDGDIDEVRISNVVQ